MRRIFFICLLLAVTPLSVLAAAGPTEEKENYPDGTLHFRVPLNSKGERNGTYTAYFPGKKLQERARYENGQLNGVREQYDDKGKLLAEEAWINGRLIAPKSPKQIEAARIQILKDSATAVQKMPTLSNPRAPGVEPLAKSIAKLNTYRYLADVSPDVTLDDSYVNLCQYAAELLVQVGHLTHSPERPAGISDEAYKLGKDGCGRSNLFVGGDITGSVDAYMNDSDKGNIDRLGHRRWVLNPKMAKTGFGGSGKFAAMYSFDGSRTDTPDYDYVCYPPRGYCPMNLFSNGWAWHVTVNPSKYKVDSEASLTIYPVDNKLRRADKPLELDYKNVNKDGFGVPNAIIAKPKGFAMKPNMLYEVVVGGVKSKDGKAAEISYFVSFY